MVKTQTEADIAADGISARSAVRNALNREDSLSTVNEFDVAVIGGGMAGMTAANRAAELGKKVVVLEQGSEERYLCNSRYTGGSFHTCLKDIMTEEGALTQAIIDATGGFVEQKMAAMVATEGRRAVRWLQGEGARFMRADVASHRGWMLAPPPVVRPGLNWEGRGGDVTLRQLEANLVKRGGRLVRQARATSLVMEGGACKGVVTTQPSGEVQYATAAVVIADGGFPANLDLLRQYVCKHPEKLKLRNAETGKGDGLRMALAAGAATRGLDRFYGHVLCRDALTNPKLWPYPYLDNILHTAIVVGPDGRRFVDEGRGGVFVANMIAQLDDPLTAAVVFDQGIWEAGGRQGIVAANPHLPMAGGTLHKADTLEGIAQILGVDAAALKATVQAYNEAIANGTLDKLAPARRTTKHQPQAIVKAPYYAIPACAGITNTFGGVLINEHAQAMSTGGTPIPGLYVAGGATGGVEGGPEIGYVGGLVKAAVTGLRAAEHLAGRAA